MLSNLRGKAKKLGVDDQISNVKEKATLLLEQNLPKIQSLFKEKIGPMTKDAVQNDEIMRRSFRIIYKLLPLPIRLVTKEDSFIEFCLKNRDRIIEHTDEENKDG